MRARVVGSEQLHLKFGALGAETQALLGKLVMMGGRKIEALAAAGCPVDTGRLRGSITTQLLYADMRGAMARVGPHVEYGIFVEMGTRPHLAPVGERWARRHGFPKGTRIIRVSGRPHPFMRPAAIQGMPFVRGLWDAALRKHFGRKR
jgi:HK97 gp10 family phage protein